jgi:hypothetical protein
MQDDRGPAQAGGAVLLQQFLDDARRQEIRLRVQASGMPVEIDRGNPVSGSNSSRHAANATPLVGQKNSISSLWTQSATARRLR